jgi:hypothetical protein
MKKLYCIGHCRSGQKSLCKIAEILGYKNIVFNPAMREELDEADFSIESGCSMFFRYLVLKYPDAAFVFQTRSIDGWLESCKKILDDPEFSIDRFQEEKYKNAAIRNRSYRWWGLEYDERRMCGAYYSHLRNVCEFFMSVKKPLLHIDMTTDPSLATHRLIQHVGLDPKEWKELIDDPPKVDFYSGIIQKKR